MAGHTCRMVSHARFPAFAPPTAASAPKPNLLTPIMLLALTTTDRQRKQLAGQCCQVGCSGVRFGRRQDLQCWTLNGYFRKLGAGSAQLPAKNKSPRAACRCRGLFRIKSA